MERLQTEVAAAAAFVDALGFDPARVGEPDGPVVVGVDQAFLDDGGRAASAAVAWCDGAVERTGAVVPVEFPYVPGLLSFREGRPALAALDALEAEPDLLLVDGSGRLHPRGAGLATHLGVVDGLPAVGVAKSLLCGRPEASVDGRPAGWRTPIRADDGVALPAGTVLGHAYQSRQYDATPRINPLYVSPGHRVAPETAVDLVAACCRGYKLPEPTRLADAHAATVRDRAAGGGDDGDAGPE